MSRYILGILSYSIFTFTSFSQIFTEQSSIYIQPTSFGSLSWGDYDNDNDLDLLITGLSVNNQPITKIYANDGNNSFSEQSGISLLGVCLSTADWGDYDNDGFLDIIICGNTSPESFSPVTKIYKNKGNNTFAEQSAIEIIGVSQGSVAWADYNNDGKLDFLIQGQSLNGLTSKIYRNNGNNSFSEELSLGFPGVKNGSIDWGDYNNDGNLDVLLTGYNGNNRITKLYKNNGTIFIEQTSILLTGVSDGSALWGDYDSDGDSDILLTGTDGSHAISKVYRNNGNNSFTEITSTNLFGIQYGSAAWGDFDNNGYLDIFFTGASNIFPYIISKIYLNNKIGSFIELDSLSIQGVYFSSAASCDYDNDGDLDLVLNGIKNNTLSCKIFNNECTVSNVSPYSPSNLSSFINGTDVTLFWNRSEDEATPSKGLSYNVVIGTSPNSYNILSPMSDRNNGHRMLVDLGNANQDTFFTIKNLPKGKYYWSVQSIDNNYSSSSFTEEQNFINYIPFTEQSSIILQGVLYSSTAWGDYDNDNDLDLLITGMNQTEQGISKIYRNEGNNNFVEQTSISLTGVYLGSTAWGDYDNDGYLDILLTGYTSPTTSVSKIYRNNGNNSFSELASSPLIGVGYSASAWGDFNNDGYLDIIITGRNGDTWLSKIYKNNGNGTFTDQTTINLLGVGSGSVAWGDYDNDGKLDILLTGTTGNLNSVSKIYRNMGDGTFIELSSLSLPGVFYSSVSWGDFDSDGDLDIALAGLNVNSPITKIYRNEGSNNFEELNISELIPVQAGSIVFGDYDNDGLLDLLISGQTQENLTITKLYKNKGGNSFIEDTSVSIIGVRNSTCNWIDYDNDGDLDIFISGFTGQNRVSKIFKNNFYIPNNLPSSPIELITEINGNSVTFKWNRSSDNETPSKGLKYNLVLGTTPMANNCISPMSNRQNGFRKILGLGNANHNTTWTIKNLPKGSYYWAVQSIDNSLAGSPFSEEKTFNVGEIKIIPEGLFNEELGILNMRDTVLALLKNAEYPYSLVDSAVVVIDSITFSGLIEFSNALTGTFYLGIKHRNSIETWSEFGGISLNGATTLNYDFTNDSSKALGNNLIKVGDKWCMFSGDINGDGMINVQDLEILFDDMRYIHMGYYLLSDLSGDGIIDSQDSAICYNNMLRGIVKVVP